MDADTHKLWLVGGKPGTDRYMPPEYSTDPRQYNLPDSKPMTDDEYAEVANSLRAFRSLADAHHFAYSCKLETVWGVGYRRHDDRWELDDSVTEELLCVYV